MIGNNIQFECTLPNLKILETEAIKPLSFDVWMQIHMDNICIKAPNITMLNAKKSNLKILNQSACLDLFVAHLSKSQISISNTSTIIVPHLEELYLNEITYNSAPLTNIKVLNHFKMSMLRKVDLSSNQIAIIDREDSLLLSTVTYLNLRNNALTSLMGLQHIRNIRVLLLGRNEIGIVPEMLLGKKK